MRTGADGYNVPDFVCDIYFQEQRPCLGGVIALNGKDGSELWRHWAQHEVFGLNCNEDLTKDGVHDCLVSGRAGVRRFSYTKLGACMFYTFCIM